MAVADFRHIVDKLVKECFLVKSGRDSYTINKQKSADYEFNVKEEADRQIDPIAGKTPPLQDQMYMKALQMNYVTVTKLLSKLKGEANPSTVRKIIAKMTQDGFLEPTTNRRLGKRVVHSDLTENKLKELKQAFDNNSMEIDTQELHDDSNQPEFRPIGSNIKDMSTCGALHSIGSDLTRMRGRSDVLQENTVRTQQTNSKTKDHGNTPTSRVAPVASRESFVMGKENCRTNVNNTANGSDMVDMVICSGFTQDKRSRKTSTVKEPILQYFTKRHKL